MTATKMRVQYSYLEKQFSDMTLAGILNDVGDLALSGDFTLGKAVSEFEGRVIAMTDLPHAVGVSSGTDALILSLLALGIGAGDEVITASNSFVASAGAVAMTGATPVLVDNLEDFTIDPEAIERAITPKTRAIIPVHLTGTMAAMPTIMDIADYLSARHGRQIAVIEDAAQAMGATLHGNPAGFYGETAAISLHPLKMLNVWGDGGVVVTRFESIARQLRLLRNHGLESRDDAVLFGTTGRLASIQAVVANHVIQTLPAAIKTRRRYAAYLDAALEDLAPRVQTPIRPVGVEPVHQTYILRCEKRDELQRFMLDRGVDVKIHYPKPIHLQTIGRRLGYNPGDLPVAERHAQTILTLPFNEYLEQGDLDYVVEQLWEFFR